MCSSDLDRRPVPIAREERVVDLRPLLINTGPLLNDTNAAPDEDWSRAEWEPAPEERRRSADDDKTRIGRRIALCGGPHVARVESVVLRSHISFVIRGRAPGATAKCARPLMNLLGNSWRRPRHLGC